MPRFIGVKSRSRYYEKTKQIISMDFVNFIGLQMYDSSDYSNWIIHNIAQCPVKKKVRP